MGIFDPVGDLGRCRRISGICTELESGSGGHGLLRLVAVELLNGYADQLPDPRSSAFVITGNIAAGAGLHIFQTFCAIFE